MARETSRFIQTINGFEDLMIKANIYLSHHRAETALEVYTKIIYEVSPGNPCALLNRSLAYLVLGYPELAVADAYRAATFIYDLDIYESSGYPIQTDQTQNGALIRATAKYLRIEQLYLEMEEKWTTRPAYNSGWLEWPMAKIIIGAPLNAATRSGIPWKTLELTALFRLSGALWYCGGGAISDALGMIDEALARGKYDTNHLNRNVRIQFVSLGNLIMEDVEEHLSQNSTSFQVSMRNKTTLVNRVVYPWNDHEHSKDIFTHVSELEKYISKTATSCTALPLPSASTRSGLRLVASKDMYPKELVLRETSALQVTASAADNNMPGSYCDVCSALLVTPDELRQRTFISQPSSPGASTIASPPYNWPKTVTESFWIPTWTTSPANQRPAVSVHQNSGSDFSSQTSPTSPPPDTNPYDTSTAPVHGEPPQTGSKHSQSGRSDSPHDRPTPLNTPDLESEFTCCNECKQVSYCSRECYDAASFHDVLCNKKVELEIRSSYLAAAAKLARSDPEDWVDGKFVHPKERCLYDLLLVRILGMTYNDNVHPLDQSEVRWLNGGLLSPDALVASYEANRDGARDLEMYDSSLFKEAQKLKLLPWTFMNNVVRPIQYIKTLGFDHSDQHLHVKNFDGWVINTLYAKIMESTQINEGARLVKVYNDEGMLVSAETPGSDKLDQAVLSGSIFPTYSLVGVTNASLEEKPNVDDTDLGTVRCVCRPIEEETNENNLGGESANMDLSDEQTMVTPTSPQQNPCIRAGEPILRSGATISTRSRVSSMGSWLDRISDNLTLDDNSTRVLAGTGGLLSSPDHRTGSAMDTRDEMVI